MTLNVALLNVNLHAWNHSLFNAWIDSHYWCRWQIFAVDIWSETEHEDTRCHCPWCWSRWRCGKKHCELNLPFSNLFLYLLRLPFGLLMNDLLILCNNAAGSTCFLNTYIVFPAVLSGCVRWDEGAAAVCGLDQWHHVLLNQNIGWGIFSFTRVRDQVRGEQTSAWSLQLCRHSPQISCLHLSDLKLVFIDLYWSF